MKIKLLQDFCKFTKGDIFEVSRDQISFIDEIKNPWIITNTDKSYKAFEFIEEENDIVRNLKVREFIIVDLESQITLLKEENQSLEKEVSSY